MRIYMSRHGQTEWNKENRLQGRADIPLNEYGRRLAAETGERMREIAFDVAFTSPLQRAKETAQIIIGDRNVPIIDEERIIEIGFGKYEGLRYGEKYSEIPDEKFTDFFSKPEAYVPTGGGESFADVKIRAKSFLDELFASETYKDSTVLVSTHGAALCGLLSVIKNAPMEKYWGDGLHKNCGFSIVDVKDGHAKVVKERIVLYNE